MAVLQRNIKMMKIGTVNMRSLHGKLDIMYTVVCMKGKNRVTKPNNISISRNILQIYWYCTTAELPSTHLWMLRIVKSKYAPHTLK